jgi:DNA polymerase-3 subunit alpha
MPSTLIKDSFFDDFQDVTFDVKGVRLPKIIIPHHYYAKLGIDESTDNEEFLKILCRNGIKSKGLTGKKEYMTRLKYEYEIVSEIGFSDYFILIWDVINFCHENDIPVGKGRGSAAGSLILYLIGVTGIDPIQNDLIFERFVSRTRAKSQIIDGVRYIDGDMAPDVDLDICTDRREEVINYLKNKYSGKFCKLPTISTFVKFMVALQKTN